MALSAAVRAKWSCFCSKKIWGSSPAKSMKILAQTDFCLYLSDAASRTKLSMTNSIQIGRVQIRCLQILMSATPSYQACGCTKVWCHYHTIKALNEAKIARKLCLPAWFNKNKSLKQTDLPALLSVADTNAIWASKLQHHFTIAEEWQIFVKWLLFQLFSNQIKWRSRWLSF